MLIRPSVFERSELVVRYRTDWSGRYYKLLLITGIQMKTYTNHGCHERIMLLPVDL